MFEIIIIKLFQNHRTMYRLIACQTTSRKVMVILPLCDLYDCYIFAMYSQTSRHHLISLKDQDII